MNKKIAIATTVAFGIAVGAIAIRSDPALTKVFLSTDSTNLASGDGTTVRPIDVVVSRDPSLISGAGTATSPLSAVDTLGVTLGMFGDGSDGDATISANTTLSRNMYYDNLTISPDVIVNANAFRIRVYGTLTMESGSIIHRSGGNGGRGTNASSGIGSCANASIGTGGTPNALPVGANGGTQNFGSGLAGSPTTSAPFLVADTVNNRGTACDGSLGEFVGGSGLDGVPGRGGGGGAGGCAAPPSSLGIGFQAGPGGNLVVAPATLGSPRWIFSAILGLSLSSTGTSNRWGGGSGPISSGGGGGSCSRAASSSVSTGGGGGGAGGGWVVVTARRIVCNGCIGIQAKGGNGGDGGSCRGNEAGGGGGGGGGGGVVVCVVASGSCPPMDASGGTGGQGSIGCGTAAANIGGNGGNGGDGFVISYRMGPA